MKGEVRALKAQGRGRGRPRDASKEAAIIGAAQTLFLERGVDGASMDAIAERAGVSKATVYARYGDKDQLFSAAVQAKCAEFMDSETLTSTDARSARDGLLAIATRFQALITAPEPMAMLALMSLERPRNPNLPLLFFETGIMPTQRKVALFLEQETARGRLAVDDPARAAWQFLGMVKSEAHMRSLLGAPLPDGAAREAYLRSCVDVFLKAYGPDASRRA